MAFFTSTFSSVWSGISNACSKTKTFAVEKLDVQKGQAVIITEPRKTIVPVACAAILFFSWGLAYGLLDILNYHVRLALQLPREKAALLALSYYAAYLCTPIIHGPIVKKCGYRVAMFLGLTVLATGMEFMSIGAANCSFNGMVGGHFVIGLGVSMLERAANPYCTNCGPRSQATLRLLIAQAWAGIGTVVAPFLANAFVFNPDSSGNLPLADPSRPGTCLAGDSAAGSCDKLGSVITFYRLLGLVVYGMSLGLGLLFFRTHAVPEVLVPSSPKTGIPSWKFWKHPLVSLRYSRVWWGLAANFINLGCQVTFAQFFIEHMKINACQSDRWAANAMSIAQGAFVIGRFAAAAFVAFPSLFKPRYVLATFIAGAVAFTAAGTHVTGYLAISIAAGVMFFEAPSFPMIFESATAGFGEWTPTCETLVIMSISGGGLLPLIMGKLTGIIGVASAWWLVVGCFAAVWTYPLATCIIPSYSKALDAAESGIGKESRSGSDVEPPSEREESSVGLQGRRQFEDIPLQR